MEIPYWLEPVANKDDLEKIKFTVETAERKTAGEIVPMIVHSSITFGHVPFILLLGFLLIFWTLIPFIAPAIPEIPFWSLEIGSILLSVLGAWAWKGSDHWKRWLTTPQDQELSVLRRAQLEFYQSNIKKTEWGTGVLIFVSLLERRAVVLADQNVADKLPEETWAKVVDQLVLKVKAGEFSGGMCEAIETVGKLLAEHLPVATGDRNELPDLLVIKE